MVKHRVWEGYNIGLMESRHDPHLRGYIVRMWPTWSRELREDFKEGLRHGLKDRKS